MQTKNADMVDCYSISTITTCDRVSENWAYAHKIIIPTYSYKYVLSPIRILHS